MNNTFGIIGGDLRIIHLAKMLAEDNKKVYTFGLEEAENLKNIKNINNCKTLDNIHEQCDIIIGAIPLSSDGVNINTPFSKNNIKLKDLIDKIHCKIFIAGSIKETIYDIIRNKNVEIIDLMKLEELAILNSIATAEGAISSIIINTDKILQESKILILGFGRIAKTLAKKLVGLSAVVTCAARKEEDLAWIKTYGYNTADINKIGNNLHNYDIIINTVPNILLNKDRLQYVNKDCLILDLASNPGGIDKEIAKSKNLKCITALALPGKVAPITSAEFIKDAIYKVLQEKVII